MTNLMAQINGLQIGVEGISLKYQMDKINTFDIEVLASDIDYRNIKRTAVSIVDRGVIVVSGYINKVGSLKIDKMSRLTIKLSCEDELGRLSCYRAYADSHYQDVAIITIISDLLTSMTGGDWVLQLDNMPDPAITTTVDLRGKKHLFGQITEVVKSTPDVHLRYGGIQVTGEHILEIGNFITISARGSKGSNIENLTLQPPKNQCVGVLESSGDLSADRIVTLADALLDARTILHPDYAQFPITLDAGTGAYICTNTSVINGCEERKKFNVHKTKNDTVPSDAEIYEAGYALWLKTVRYLKASQDYEVYKAEIYLSSLPIIGDRMQLDGIVSESVYDVTSGVIDYHETFRISGDFRMTKINTKFERGNVVFNDMGPDDIATDEVLYTIELSSNDESEEIDPDLALFEALENYDGEDNPSAGVFLTLVSTSLSYNTGTHSPDGSCTGTAKEFVIAPPATPAGATTVTAIYTTTPSNAIVEVIQIPASLGDDWIGCIQQAGGGWSAPAQDITVTIFWQFA